MLPQFPPEEESRQPQAILDTRLRNGNHEFIVHWHGLAPSEASWEVVPAFAAQFPSFKFEDKLASQGGSRVMNREEEMGRDLENKFTHGKY